MKDGSSSSRLSAVIALGLKGESEERSTVGLVREANQLTPSADTHWSMASEHDSQLASFGVKENI